MLCGRRKPVLSIIIAPTSWPVTKSAIMRAAPRIGTMEMLVKTKTAPSNPPAHIQMLVFVISPKRGKFPVAIISAPSAIVPTVKLQNVATNGPPIWMPSFALIGDWKAIVVPATRAVMMESIFMIVMVQAIQWMVSFFMNIIVTGEKAIFDPELDVFWIEAFFHEGSL